jgi:DNA-binding NarL/FixJ family response regulator
VAEVATARAAAEAARRSSPDIAILGITQRELHGVTVIAGLKEQAPDIALLVYTDMKRLKIFDEVLRAGARAYVLKDDKPEYFLAALKALAEGNSYFSWAVLEYLLSQLAHGKWKQEILTRRERQVAQMVSEGWMSRHIAARLQVVPKTIEAHRASIMKKLGLRTTADLVRYAIRHNLIHA